MNKSINIYKCSIIALILINIGCSKDESDPEPEPEPTPVTFNQELHSFGDDLFVDGWEITGSSIGNAGDVLISGWVDLRIENYRSGILMRVSSSGELITNRSYQNISEFMSPIWDGGKYLAIGKNYYHSLLKFNDNGDVIWEAKAADLRNEIGLTETPEFTSVTKMSNGDYAILADLVTDVIVIKVDANGVYVGHKIYETTKNYAAQTIVQFNGGLAFGVKVSPTSESPHVMLVNNDLDVIRQIDVESQDKLLTSQTSLIAVDLKGNDYNYTVFNVSGDETGNVSANLKNEGVGLDMILTTSGAFVFTGATSTFGNLTPSVYLEEVSTAGIVNWTSVIKVDFEQRGLFVHELADGGYFVVSTSQENHRVFVTRTNASGSF